MMFGIIAGAFGPERVAGLAQPGDQDQAARSPRVRDLFDEWLRPRRAFRLVNSGEMGTNPDQRIHEDARHLSELTADLGLRLLQSSLLLGSFIGVLWMLPEKVTFYLSGRNFAIPGYMVFAD